MATSIRSQGMFYDRTEKMEPSIWPGGEHALSGTCLPVDASALPFTIADAFKGYVLAKATQQLAGM